MLLSCFASLKKFFFRNCFWMLSPNIKFSSQKFKFNQNLAIIFITVISKYLLRIWRFISTNLSKRWVLKNSPCYLKICKWLIWRMTKILFSIWDFWPWSLVFIVLKSISKSNKFYVHEIFQIIRIAVLIKTDKMLLYDLN